MNVLGDGAFGDVVLAKEKKTNTQFAVKKMLKAKFNNKQSSKIVMNERNVLVKCNHLNIVKLYSAFRDDDYFYYVMTLAENGELLKYIRKFTGLHMDCTRYITAEIVNVLQYLHTNVGVIHRDLKPENILVTSDWHILLTDFGTSKIVEFEVGKVPTRGSFVGTPEYVPPELIQDTMSCFAMDLWALGCTIYQLLTGRVPFKGANAFLTMKKVQEGVISWPEPFPSVAKELILSLLKTNPTERLGAQSYDDLKAHPFFTGIDWQNLHNVTPPEYRGPEQKMVWEEDVLREEQERIKEEKEKLRKKWSQFLLDTEDIEECGLIIKTRKMSTKRRFLILTTLPRLFYVDPKKMVLKGEIVWSNKLKVVVKDDVFFKVVIPGRNYELQDISKDSNRWLVAINKALENSNKNE